MAKGILLRIPRRGDIAAIWRLERVLRLCVPGFDSCCASRLNRDVSEQECKRKARYIHGSFDERIHVELGCDEPVIRTYKWFA